MAEAWFDTVAGELLTTKKAAQQRIQELGAAVVLLAPLVRDEEFPYSTGDYELPDTRDWTPEQCVEYGKFVLRILTSPGEPKPPLQREHFRRLRILGLGAPPTQLGRQLRTFTNFKNAIGAPTVGDISRFRGEFQNIQPEAVLKMIEKVATGLGHRVTWPDYRAAKRRGKVPSDKTVLTMFGGLRNVNDILGYPDVSLWEPDDFLDFGMRFLHTNGTEKFTTTGFDVLARRDRGPWTKNVSLQFDTWSNYKSKTLHNWEEKQARKTMRLTAYRKDISEGRLPAVFKQLDDDELLSKVARYRVATECAPHISEVRRLEAAGLVTPEGFSRRLKLDASYADEGYVEMVALSRNLLDDMWPPPLDARIYVSDQEIETAKAARRAREKDRRQTAVDTAQLSQAA